MQVEADDEEATGDVKGIVWITGWCGHCMTRDTHPTPGLRCGVTTGSKVQTPSFFSNQFESMATVWPMAEEYLSFASNEPSPCP